MVRKYKYKVGDIVRIVGDKDWEKGTGWEDFINKLGTIDEIYTAGGISYPYKVRTFDGFSSPLYEKEIVRPVKEKIKRLKEICK